MFTFKDSNVTKNSPTLKNHERTILWTSEDHVPEEFLELLNKNIDEVLA